MKVGDKVVCINVDELYFANEYKEPVTQIKLYETYTISSIETNGYKLYGTSSATYLYLRFTSLAEFRLNKINKFLKNAKQHR